MGFNSGFKGLVSVNYRVQLAVRDTYIADVCGLTVDTFVTRTLYSKRPVVVTYQLVWTNPSITNNFFQNVWIITIFFRSTWFSSGNTQYIYTVGGDIFRTRPDRPWNPPILLYYGNQVIRGGGIKRPGRVVDHPRPSSAEVKERVELYLYSTFEFSWPILRWT
jgi:hypothetical protein